MVNEGLFNGLFMWGCMGSCVELLWNEPSEVWQHSLGWNGNDSCDMLVVHWFNKPMMKKSRSKVYTVWAPKCATFLSFQNIAL